MGWVGEVRRKAMTCHAVAGLEENKKPQPSLGHSSPLLVRKGEGGIAVVRGLGHSFIASCVGGSVVKMGSEQDNLWNCFLFNPGEGVVVLKKAS